MGQSILGIDLQSAHEIFGCFFQVPFFVAKRSAIEQSIDFLWINAQSMIVRFDCLRPSVFLVVILECGLFQEASHDVGTSNEGLAS